jgi:hypothetical protein
MVLIAAHAAQGDPLNFGCQTISKRGGEKILRQKLEKFNKKINLSIRIMSIIIYGM